MSTIIVRQLSIEDWHLYKDVRLRALKQEPSNFSSPYEREARYADIHWQYGLQKKSSAVFGLFDGDIIVGLTGVFTWNGDPSGTTAILNMSYIDTKYRGKGYSDYLFKARIAWAETQNKFKSVRVAHRQNNKVAEAMILKNRFLKTEEKEIKWPDGTFENEYIYNLKIG